MRSSWPGRLASNSHQTIFPAGSRVGCQFQRKLSLWTRNNPGGLHRGRGPAHLAEGNARQARKRVSADVLIRDAGQRILLVDPYMWRRVSTAIQALATGRAQYLQDGYP
jgi:hypothetical protein